MTPAARERSRVRTPLLVVTAISWVLLLFEARATQLNAHCAMDAWDQSAGEAVPHSMGQFGPSQLMSGWLLMLSAMMLPMLIAPVRHVYDQSLARRRIRSIMIFLAGYVGFWIAAGAIFIALMISMREMISGHAWATICSGVGVALFWQFSPARQYCLNRQHFHPALAPFGIAADLGPLRFGLEHGSWCAGSCWAFMLVPLCFTQGHLFAMTAVTLFMWADKLEPPLRPAWQLRLPRKAANIVIAELVSCF